MIKLGKNNTELSYDEYVHRGNIMYLREGLPISDPDNLYNYLKNSPILQEAKLSPEDFGILHPVIKKYGKYTKEELMSVITELVIKNETINID